MKYKYLRIVLALGLGTALGGCPMFEIPQDMGADGGVDGADNSEQDEEPSDSPANSSGGSDGGTSDRPDLGVMPNVDGGTDDVQKDPPRPVLGGRFYDLIVETGLAVCECVSGSSAEAEIVCGAAMPTVDGIPLTPEIAACREAQLAAALTPEQLECVFQVLGQQIACIKEAAQLEMCDGTSIAGCESPEDVCGVNMAAIGDGNDACGAGDSGVEPIVAEDIFVCPSGDRLPAEWVCDGDNDCGDFADEQSCSGIDNSAGGDFACDNGNFVPASYACDAYDDCGDNSDEVGCVEQR